MLNLILKPQYLIPALITLGAFSYGWYWHSQYNKAQTIIAQQTRENANIKASNDLLQSAVQRWKAAADKYDQQLKRREALVAKRTIDSDKRIKTIYQGEYSQECDQAIQQGIARLVNLEFNWNNNIP
jgi:hypothetical protein